jgi:hypothetical protein
VTAFCPRNPALDASRENGAIGSCARDLDYRLLFAPISSLSTYSY